MGQNNLQITDKGVALKQKAQAGATLSFTRFGVGDGIAPASMTGMTALVNELKSIPISSAKIEDGESTITAILNNSGLAEALTVRETGLFAMDPDEGEILFAVTNSGDQPDYLPPDGIEVVELVLKFVIMVERIDSVSAVLSSDTYADAGALSALQFSVMGIESEIVGLRDLVEAVPLEYSPVDHDHSGIYEPVITKKSGFNLDKSDSITSTSSLTLATSKAVKSAYDIGSSAINQLGNHEADGNIHVKITNGTGDPSGGSDGDVYLQY